MMLATPVAAQQQFGPFFLSPEAPTAIVLNGAIDDRSGLEFRRVLAAAEIVILKSLGGLV
jgi:hypothetical protein